MKALFLTLLASLALAQQTEVYNPYADRMRTRDSAFLILPPERAPFDFVISTWGTEGVLIVVTTNAPSGYTSLKTKMSDEPKEEVFLYDIDSKKKFKLSGRGENGPFEGLTYPIGRHKGTVLYASEEEFALWNIRTNAVRSLPEADNYLLVEDHPYLFSLRGSNITAYALAGGEVWTSQLPDSAANMYFRGAFEDGIELSYLTRSEGRNKNTYITVSANNGQVGEVRSESLIQRETFDVESFASVSGQRDEYDYFAVDGSREELPPNLLPHQLPSRAPVALEAAFSQSLTRGEKTEAVLFIRDNQLYIRRVEQIPLSVYEEAFISDYKYKVMMRAKQVGTAMHIYSSDYDDNFPPLELLPDALKPYLKNDALLEGVVFVQSGNNRQFDDVSNTILAYVDTPYGRATIAVDSSVRWRNP